MLMRWLDFTKLSVVRKRAGALVKSIKVKSPVVSGGGGGGCCVGRKEDECE